MRSRTTISLKCKVFQQALDRAKNLGYQSFSEYVAYLLDKDLQERGEHVVVREESSGYGNGNGNRRKRARKSKG